MIPEKHVSTLMDFSVRTLRRLSPFVHSVRKDEVEAVHIQLYGVSRILLGDLIMMALILTAADNEIAPEELELINRLLESIYGDRSRSLKGETYRDLMLNFHKHYPKAALTLDSKPLSIRALDELANTETYDADELRSEAQDLLSFFGEAILSSTCSDYDAEHEKYDFRGHTALENFIGTVGEAETDWSEPTAPKSVGITFDAGENVAGAIKGHVEQQAGEGRTISPFWWAFLVEELLAKRFNSG